MSNPPYGQNPYGQNPYGQPSSQPSAGWGQPAGAGGQPPQQPGWGQPAPWGQPPHQPGPPPQQGWGGGQLPPQQPGQPPAGPPPGQPWGGPQGQPSAQPQRPVPPTPVPEPEPRRAALVERDIIVATIETVPGREVSGVLGEVVGVVTRPRDMRAQPDLAVILTESRQAAVGAMVEMATAAGADAVVGLRFDGGKISEGASEVTAYGTAVKLSGGPQRASLADDESSAAPTEDEHPAEDSDSAAGQPAEAAPADQGDGAAPQPSAEPQSQPSGEQPNPFVNF